MYADKLTLDKLTKRDFDMTKLPVPVFADSPAAPEIKPAPVGKPKAKAIPQTVQTPPPQPVTETATERPAVKADISDEAVLLDIIGNAPVHVDDIAERAGWTTSKTLSVLLKLELNGKVTALAGSRYSGQ